MAASSLPIETPETPQGPVATELIGGVHFQKVIPANADGTTVDPATQATLAAILAKIIAAPATEATLAAILAAFPALATDAGLAAIHTKLSGDPATQTTLAALLAKVSNDPATQTTLAAIFARVPALGQALAAASVPVVLTAVQQAALAAPVLGAGENHVGFSGVLLGEVTGSFARPANATAYTIGDIVSNDASTTTPIVFTNIARVNGGTGRVVGVRMTTNKKSITPQFRLWLFNESGPTVSADNAAFRTMYADRTKRVATVEVQALLTPADTTNSDESRVSHVVVPTPFVCAASTRNLWGVLELVSGAFTPDSGQAFSITLIVEND